ncbi:unnamed protein product [Blepharisma stoltei]|uniref:TmcB/TmcC TPR repeats domain-containing protein n=1 Tax=Blepharisma stoltei TaxID=1481888 RepID=A0AAU9JKG4_9CILI|nr:unnamed protein product [Blepharisma stoltei]
MFELDSEIDQPTTLRKNNIELKPKKSIIKSVFKFYSLMYYKKFFGEDSLTKQKIKLVIEVLFWCVQIIALLWFPHLSIEDWSNNMIIWKIIGYFRIDNACSALGIIDKCFYILIAGIFAIFSSAVLLILSLYYSVKVPKIIFAIFEKIIYLWLALLYIPSLVLLSIFSKYHFLNHDHVLEYENTDNLSDFKITASWQMVSISAIMLSFLIAILSTEFSGEIRHCAAKNIVKSKSNSRVELHAAIFTFIFSILYPLSVDNYTIYFQFSILAASTLLIWEILTFSPYFSVYSNTLEIIRFFLVALISFLFILGYWIDNSLLITIFAIFLVPISILCIIQFILKKSKTRTPPIIVDIKNKFDLEKYLRSALCSNDVENKDEIIGIFEIFFKKKIMHRDKLQIVWAANYCIYALKNEALAKIKLSKSKSISDWSLEANYQQYLCHKAIISANSNESISFGNYHQNLNKVKKEDKKLCLNLLEFWREITSKSPGFFKLTKTLNSIDTRIEFLNDEYKELASKYHKSKEILSLYSSYLKNILFEIERSEMLIFKLKSLKEIYLSSDNTENFSYFDTNNGVLIISNEEKNLGEILYSNSKTAGILNFPLESIIGSNIKNFIPFPYNKEITEKLSNLIDFSSDTEISLHKGFFLISPMNFLLECTGKMLFSSINNVVVTILIFKLKQARYQSALISNDGVIFSCSEGFPVAAGASHNNVIGASISNLFFDLKQIDIKPFIPYKLPNFAKETIMVLSNLECFDMKMLYILLINDFGEIQKWTTDCSNSHKIETQRGGSIQNMLLSVEDPSIIHENHSEILDSKSDQSSDESSKMIENILIDKYEEKTQNTDNENQIVFIHMMKISARSINALHCVFILCILIVLGSNISVLSYAVYSINLARDISLSRSIGDIGKSFQQMAFLSRIIGIVSYFPDSEEAVLYCFNLFKSDIANLEDIYINIGSNLTKWDSCSSQSIFTGKNINLWNIGPLIYQEKVNLIDTVSQFIIYGKEFVRKFNTTEDYSNTVLFFALNGYGEAFNYCNNSLYDVTGCKKSEISGLKSEMFALLIIGIAAMAIGICIMTPFCYFAIKTENMLWNNIRKNAYKHYHKLKKLCFKRLANVHFQLELADHEETRYKKRLNFKNYWKYIWRASLFFIITSLFCLLNIFIFYEKCAEYLYCRPEIIKSLIHSQVFITSLSIWTSETGLYTTDYSLQNMLPFALPFSDSNIKLRDIISLTKHSLTSLRSTQCKSIFSKSYTEELYEYQKDGDIQEHTYGVYGAEEVAMLDAYYIAYYENASVEDWLKFIVQLQKMNDKYDEFIDENNQHSQNLIDDQISTIIIFLVLFVGLSFGMYMGLYLTFFRREKKYLRKINSMLKLMPG